MDHVRMRSVVSAQRIAAGRSIGWFLISNRVLILMHVGGGAKCAPWQDGKYSDASAKIVGHEGVSTGSVDTQMSRACTLGTYGV